MNAVVERITTVARVVPLLEAVELNPRPDRGTLPDDLNVSFVPMAAVEAATGRMDANASRRFGEVKKGYTVFREGDVLFAKITPCMENGKMAVARDLHNGIGCGSTEFHVLRPKPGVDAQYVYHFVSRARFRAEAAHHMTGAVGQKRVPAAFFEQCEIPLPDLDEQRRIVAELEKQFSRLDEGVANLKRVKANLKRYKAAVIKGAVEGRLVPTEAELARRDGRHFESGAEFHLRILESRRFRQEAQGKHSPPKPVRSAPRGTLPEGWVWSTLDALSWNSSYGTSVKCSYENTGPAVVRIPNVQDVVIDFQDLKFAPSDFSLSAASGLDEGDLLIIRTNGSKPLIGRAALVTEKPRSVTTYASYLIRFRVVRLEALPAWVALAWQSSRTRSWIEAHAATSAGQHNVSQSLLASAAIPLPPPAEQRRIIDEVDRRLTTVEALAKDDTVALTRAERIRTAVLDKGFRVRHGSFVK